MTTVENQTDTADSAGSSSPSNDPFPLEARVLLQGLQKAPELNNKIGVIKTKLSDAGRHTVYVHELKRSMNVKPANLVYEPRAVDSLSIKELKLLIQSKKIVQDDNEMTGLDKAELKAKVREAIDSNDEIAEILAKAQEPKSPPPKSKKSKPSSVDPTQAADQLSSMNPEQLRQQARMMRTMPPSQIRSMNPALANMTDAQIRMAADQMEMMASNPQMMQSAAQQMKNMDPAELERMKGQMNSGAPMPTATNAAGRTNASATPSASQAQQAADMMKNMTPEQLKQQADMLRNMDPDTIRSMNPQMAGMSDEQIKMAATQFDMMAANPAMLDMALNQMKDMDPDQIAKMQQQGQGGVPGSAPGAPGGPGAGMDPTQMLANMDKDQLKMMLKSLKENPDMMKQFAQMTGMSPEQLAQGVDMFASMDDNKLDGALKMMQRAQQAKDLWAKADSKTGGYLKYIAIVMTIVMAVVFFYLIFWFFVVRGGSSAASTMTDGPLSGEGTVMPNIHVEKEDVVEREFESEF